MSEIKAAWDELRQHGTATVMIILCEEMSSLVAAAENGDKAAQLRLGAIRASIPLVELGDRHCVFCDRPTALNDIAAMVFVSPKIAAGTKALFAVVCSECREDPDAMAARVIKAIGAKRLFHQAGHA